MKRIFALIIALCLFTLSSCNFTAYIKSENTQSEPSFVYSEPQYKEFTAKLNENGEPLVILDYEVNARDYYYRSRLDESQREVYDIIATAVKNHDASAVIPNISGGTYVIEKIINAYHSDHPETFYWHGDMQYTEDTLTGIKVVEFDYLLDKKTTDRYILDIKKAEKEYLSFITEDMTQYEAAVIIHDLLCNNIIYPDFVPETVTEVNTIFGALVNKRAVCSGYAHAFKYLCNKVGINVISVMGTADDEPHQWNMVTIGEDSFFVDVTWDDPVMDDGSQATSYRYFGMTNKELSETHVISDSFSLPTCSTTEYNYCEKYGFVIDDEDEVLDVIVKSVAFTANEKPRYADDTYDIFLKINTATCQYDNTCDIILDEFENAMNELYYSNTVTFSSWNMTYSLGEDMLPYVRMTITLE